MTSLCSTVEKEEQTAKLTGEIDSLKIQLKASDDANKEVREMR